MIFKKPLHIMHINRLISLCYRYVETFLECRIKITEIPIGTTKIAQIFHERFG